MMSDAPAYLKLEECKSGCVYELHSRNLSVGVFDGKDGFIGIRKKFGYRYLFKEYHWDQGPPFGTVKPARQIGEVPIGVPIEESLGTVDSATRRSVSFDDERRWYFEDTGESSKDICPVNVCNDELFKVLDGFEKR